MATQTVRLYYCPVVCGSSNIRIDEPKVDGLVKSLSSAAEFGLGSEEKVGSLRFDFSAFDAIRGLMIRKANIKDIKAIYRLLQEYGNRGELLPRPLSVLYDHVRDFTVYVNPVDGHVLGCCALQFCWDDLAEIRSMAVHPDHVGQTIGSQLAQAVLDEARSFGVKKVFVLTYRPGFFEKFDFKRIDRAELPLKIWADCIMCVKFPDCDEIAMMKVIA